MNFQTMHNQRKFILIAAALGVISIFLPWVTVKMGFMGSISSNAFGGWGIIIFLSYGAAITFSLLNDQKQQLETNFWMITLFAGFLAFLITLISLLQINSAAGYGRSVGLRSADVGASIGFGAYISLVASAAVTFLAWKFKKPEDTLQKGFDSLFKGGPATTSSGNNPQRMDELEKLVRMRNEGQITEEEFRDLKSRIM